MYMTMLNNQHLHNYGPCMFTFEHCFVSEAGPSSLQSFPVPNGLGLVQVRDLLCTPLPQVTLHSDHELHFE